jgi:phosphatidylserine decarboxylase
MISRLAAGLQYLLPQRLLGRCVRAFAQSTRPWLKGPLIEWFARHYAVELADAERQTLDDYASFNDFFTRALRADARPLAPGDATLLCPADGRITEHGTAHDGHAVQAKGRLYALEDLLCTPPAGIDIASLGDFATIYLAPKDYHRVHLPLAARLVAARYVPGKRFSVNAATARAIPRLFCRNERLVEWFESGHGPFAVVLVGALNVAGIATPWLPEIETGEARFWDGRDLLDAPLDRGAEIGRFNLGSTVVVVLPTASVRWAAGLEAGDAVRMGIALGSVGRVATD